MSPSANHANSPSLDTARCPLCGGPNRCALAAAPSATECWCDSLEFPRELFAQIPDDAVRKTCVCQKSSDTDEIGWRSGVDAGSGAVSIALGGSEVCGYLGMLDSSMLQVPENMILDHEICMEVYDYYQEFNFDDYDMALDVIKAVEPKSHFLRQKHTRKHLRDFRLSKVLRAKGLDGETLPPEKAAFEELKRLDANHQPEPLPDESIAELDRILAAAEREAEKLEG